VTGRRIDGHCKANSITALALRRQQNNLNLIDIEARNVIKTKALTFDINATKLSPRASELSGQLCLSLTADMIERTR